MTRILAGGRQNNLYKIIHSVIGGTVCQVIERGNSTSIELLGVCAKGYVVKSEGEN
jgi:hypothetical protein